MEILQVEMDWVIFHHFSFHKMGGSPYKKGSHLNPVKKKGQRKM